MNITVIGCWGAFPRAGGATSGYLFEQNKYKLLVECGSAVVSKLLNYIDIKQLNAVILSHYHYDHFCDVGTLQYARLVKSQTGVKMGCLPIYAPDNNQQQFQDLTMMPYTKGISYGYGSKLLIGPFTISFFKCIHPLDCYAMRISAGGSSVFYTADTAYSERLIEASRDCDLLIAESSLYPDHSGAQLGHMNCMEAAKMASRANVGGLILSHLPAYGNIDLLLESARLNFGGPITLASEGLSRRL